jgi:hypothetical protein
MYYSKTKIYFWIEVPHFHNGNRNRESIQIEMDKDRKKFGVYINLEQRDSPEGFERATYGKILFITCMFTEHRVPGGHWSLRL